MASKKIVSKAKSKLLATLVIDNRQPCAFCRREVDDEATFGKLYAIGDIQVHYFCALLSCCLVQKGRDNEGLFGFLYHDIVAEVERSKKHKCSYCNTGGASLGCSKSQCRKQFHLPCGREKHAVSLFYGNYKSFCQQHAPKQKIPDHIMAQARLRMKKDKGTLKILNSSEGDTTVISETVCVICYEAVPGYPSPETFWPPCCARDAWFHRSCLQRMALSAGMHYLKCPLCNDKDQFYSSVVSQGLYVPDRDAAWELEQDAFAGIYERPSTCSAEHCRCERGRAHTQTHGPWEIHLCLLCGTSGCHSGCAGGARFVCAVCRACATGDMCALAARIQAVVESEERRGRQRARRPVMPSRMSLRRTKHAFTNPSTSQINNTQAETSEHDHRETISDVGTASARLDLNLRTPRRPQPVTQKNPILKTIENTMFSPTKLVEEGLNNKMRCLGVKHINPDRVINKVKEKLAKPRPLSVKKKIVNTVLDQILRDILKETHEVKQWRSPKKTCDIEELSQNNDVVDNEDETDSKEVATEAIKDEGTTEPISDLNVDDDSSSSTFQLPPEFIADRNSDDSLPLFETPKKLTTVDIQKDSSLEISENNAVVNINVVKIKEHSDNAEIMKNLVLKIPVKTEKCAFKFNPTDKESLVENNLNMDMESFKNFYLDEVDREKDFQCTFNHKHTEESCKSTKLRTAIDFALDATKTREKEKRSLKRKQQNKGGVVKKKPKKDEEIVLRYKKADSRNIKVVCSNDSENTESINLTVNKPETKKSVKNNKKIKKRKGKVTRTIDLTVQTAKNNKRLKIKKRNKNKKHRDNIQVKIRFRKEQVRLKITKSQAKNKKRKLKKVKEPPKKLKLKQCILRYGGNCSPSKVIVKPEHDVSPKKRNYVKLEKSPDTLVQTSIQSFFKKVPNSNVQSKL